MDFGPFPPSILALARGLIIACGMFVGGKGVQYGLQRDDSGEMHTNTTTGLVQIPALDRFHDGIQPCLTCQFVDTDGQLLDYYGRVVDIDRLAEPPRVTTSGLQSTLPFAITTNKPQSMPTSTGTSNISPTISLLSPPSPPSSFEPSNPVTHDLPKVEVFLILIEIILKWQWMSSFPQHDLFSTDTATPIGVMPRIWSILGLMAHRLISKIVLQALTIGFRYLWNTRAMQESVPGKGRAEWQAAEKRRLRDLAKMHVKNTLAKQKKRLLDVANKRIKKILEKEKAKMDRKTSQKTRRQFSRLQSVYRSQRNAISERVLLAISSIEQSFGPSLGNAEYEFRRQLHRFCMPEDKREEIIAIMRKVLFAYARSVAADESRPKGRNTRYFSVIDEQNSMIEDLRLLNIFREERYKECEELVRSLCCYDEHGKWIPQEFEAPEFSPVDGPVALSMAVSISTTPFYDRANPILSADLNWQRFLDSISEFRAEQEERLKPYDELDLDEVDIFETVGAGTQAGTNLSPQSGSDESRKENADNLDDRTEGKEDGEEYMYPTPVTQDAKPSFARRDRSAARKPKETAHEALSASTQKRVEFLKGEISYCKWQISYLGKGHGTPEDPEAKPLSDITPRVIFKEDGDAALARQLQDEADAVWRQERIEDFKGEVASHEAELAEILRAENTVSNETTNGVPHATTMTPSDGTKPQDQGVEAELEDDLTGGQNEDSSDTTPPTISEEDRVLAKVIELREAEWVQDQDAEAELKDDSRSGKNEEFSDNSPPAISKENVTPPANSKENFTSLASSKEDDHAALATQLPEPESAQDQDAEAEAEAQAETEDDVSSGETPGQND